jgi:hypothetical protein
MKYFKHIFNFSIALLFTASGVSAQQNDLPIARSSAHLIYSEKSKALMLLDGYQLHLDSTQSDVWAWDGIVWKHWVKFGPGSRSLTAMALNRKSGIIYSFAGLGKLNYESKKGDTWAFDGEKWEMIGTNNIGTRDHHKMVYADHLNAFVLYGGVTSTRENDTTTWIFKNEKFTPLEVPGPGIRYHFGMAYDRHRQRVVLYGGGQEPSRDETWEFDGQRWKKMTTIENPGKRIGLNMVYDEDRKMTVLHGADDAGTTWAWNGSVWKKIAEGGPAVVLPALGYDPTRKKIVAFGGSGKNNTITSALWELDEKGVWKKISDNGTWQWVDKGFKQVSN